MPVLLIIGATSDIAKACARKFASENFDLILAGRNIGELEYLQKDLQIRFQINTWIYKLDITNFNEHKRFYDNLEAKPDGVLVATGYLPEQKKAELDWTECENTILVNYSGPVSILNIIANDFEKRKNGFIIGISSVAGDRGRKSNYIYGSAKAGFSEYLSGLRGRLTKSKVHVITVKPGFVRTKMTAHLDLPKKLLTSPENVAEDIYNAYLKNKNIVYSKRVWQIIMYIIRNIPESIFKNLDF